MLNKENNNSNNNKTFSHVVNGLSRVFLMAKTDTVQVFQVDLSSDNMAGKYFSVRIFLSLRGILFFL